MVVHTSNLSTWVAEARGSQDWMQPRLMQGRPCTCKHVCPCACMCTHKCTSGNGYLFLLSSCLSLFLWCPGLRPDTLAMAQPSSIQSLPCLLNLRFAVGALTMGLAHRKPITQVQSILLRVQALFLVDYSFPRHSWRIKGKRPQGKRGREAGESIFIGFGVFFLGVFLGILALLMAWC